MRNYPGAKVRPVAVVQPFNTASSTHQTRRARLQTRRSVRRYLRWLHMRHLGLSVRIYGLLDFERASRFAEVIDYYNSLNEPTSQGTSTFNQPAQNTHPEWIVIPDSPPLPPPQSPPPPPPSPAEEENPMPDSTTGDFYNCSPLSDYNSPPASPTDVESEYSFYRIDSPRTPTEPPSPDSTSQLPFKAA
jgi:hypothetical protein